MYYIDNNSGSPTMPALSPAQSNTPTWFTEGDKNKGISWIGQDWLNILQAELLNILSEAGIKPDKGKLNQLTLSIKAIVTANAYTQANNLKEIFDAGIEAQAAARGHLGLGKLATKDSLGPADVNALAKDQNLNDVPDKAKARTALQLGNSATRNVGTTANTVAAGDDARIIATKKAIDETQTGLAAQGVMWLSTADDLSNLPSGARRFAINNTGVTVLPTADYFFIEVLAKRDTANGSCVLATSNTGDVWMGVRYTVPNDAAFTWIQLNQNVQNLGLTDTVNRASHVNATDGDLYGTQWGGWLSSYIRRNTPSVPSLTPYATTTWVNQNFLSGFRLGGVEGAQVWRAFGYDDNPPYVITGVINGNTDDLIDFIKRRPLQMYINGWRNIDWT